MADNMELEKFDLKLSLSSQGHIESYQQNKKIIRTYEEILESEIKRANPIMKGHTNEVIGAYLTNDNLFLISAGKDNTVRVWNLIDRSQEQKYLVKLELGYALTLMAMSFDESFIVFAVSNNFVIVWDLKSKDESARVPGQEDVKVLFVSISSDCLKFCVADSSRWVKVYDLTGKLMNSYQTEELSITCIAFSQNTIFIGDNSNKIIAWNTQTSQTEYKLEHESSKPCSSLLYENNRYLAVSYSNEDLVVWDLVDKNKIFKLAVVYGAITKMSYCRYMDNKSLVCISDQHKVIFIDLASKIIKRILNQHTETITSVCQSKDGKLVVTTSADRLIKIWLYGESREHKPSYRYGTSIRTSTLHKQSDQFAIAYNNQTIKLFDLAENKLKYSLNLDGQSVYTAIWSQDKKHLITSNSTPEILVFSYENKYIEFSILTEAEIKYLVILPESKFLYGCYGGKKIFVWDLDDKILDHVLESNDNQNVLVFNQDLKKMVTGGISGICVWNLNSRTVEYKLEGNVSMVNCLVMLKCGTLISGGDDGKIGFWNLEENKMETCIEEGSSLARSMDLSSDEKILVVIHNTSKITVINIQQQKIEYDFDLSPQISCKILNESTLILGDNGYIRFINLQEKKEIYSINAHIDSISSLLIDEANDKLHSFSLDCSIKTFKLSDKSQQESYQTYFGLIMILSLSTDYLAIGTKDGQVLIYEASSSKEIKNLIVHYGGINTLEYHNNCFATGSNDKRVAVFDTTEYIPYYFEGHLDWVRSVKFSFDGKLLFSASDDKMIKAWNLEKKTQEFEFEGHQGYVYSLFVFPSGKFLASGSEDKSVKLWNLESRKEEFSLEYHSAIVFCFDLSDDEKFLFSGSDDMRIAVLSLEIRKVVCWMTGHRSRVLDLKNYNGILFSTDMTGIKNWLINEKKEIFCFKSRSEFPITLCVSPDQNYLASSFNDGAIRIYDFRIGKFLETIKPFCGLNIPSVDFTVDSKSLLLAIQDYNIIIWNIELRKGQEIYGSKLNARIIKFSPDHSLFSSFSNDNKVCVWDWSEKIMLYSLEGHTSEIHYIVFSRNNKFLFTCGEDNLVIKWNLETKEKFIFKDHLSTVRSLAFSNTKNILISAGHDRKVCFYDTEKNLLIKAEEKHGDWVRTLAITKDEKIVISAGGDKLIIIWSIDTQQELFKLQGHSASIYGIAISDDNDHFYSGSGDKTLWVWSINEKARTKCLRSACGSIHCIVLNKQSTIAYTGSDENTLNIFDLVSKTEITCLFGHTNSIADIALSDDETILVSGSWDNSIRIYNTKTFEVLALFKDAHTSYIRSVCITKNNKFVISGSDDQQISFWNLEKKQKEFSLEGHRNYIHSVRLTPDEKFVISASRDETIRLWDILGRIQVHSFTGHTSPVRCLALMNDSRTFISGGEDSMIKVWSIFDKREEFTLKGHTLSVNALKLTSDNLKLISGSDDFKVNVWDLRQRTVELSLAGNSNVLAININDDGSLLLTSSSDKTLKLWKMSEPSIIRDQTTSQKPFITVHTPDNKFELTYLYGRLSEVIKTNSNSSSRKPELGITDKYDPYYKNIIQFYNLIDNIRSGQYDSFLPDNSDIIFSRFSYTIIHILSIIGNQKKIFYLLKENSKIKADYFGKSPLFYAISKHNQDCVDTILDFLILGSEAKDKSRIQSSFAAITNDFPMIIRNSSKSLHLLIKSCLFPVIATFANISEDLPVFMFNENFMPVINDFVKEGEKSLKLVPVIMKYSPFTLPCKIGSKDCIEFMEAIIQCSNKSIYNTQLVQCVLQIQWNDLRMWVLSYTFLLWLNLVLLVFLFTLENIGKTWALPVFLLANFLLIFWESIQMFMGGLIQYFREPWNLIDFSRFTLSMVWVVWNIFNYEKNFNYRILAWLVALLSFIRGLTGFRVFDGTRYYVRLILRALGDMGYFFIMLGYSTITFGIMFQVSRQNNTLDFKNLWMDSYSLNFGNFEAQDQYYFSFETIVYMLATMVNVILMLNLLISILGDSYSNFQIDKTLIDFSEKASVILEIQKMFFWVSNVGDNKYLHVLCPSITNHEEESVDGKMNAINTSIKNFNEVIRSQGNAFGEFMIDKFNLLDKKYQDKIVEVENKISKIENKLNETNEILKQILVFVKPKIEEMKVKAE